MSLQSLNAFRNDVMVCHTVKQYTSLVEKKTGMTECGQNDLKTFINMLQKDTDIKKDCESTYLLVSHQKSHISVSLLGP